MAAHRGVHAYLKWLTSLGVALRQWLHRRRTERRRIARAVWDLNERYGAAAHRIARNSARAPIGRDGRRFWRRVARQLATG